MAMSAPQPIVAPARVLGVWQAMAVAVGMVVGAGIFRSPAVVAASVQEPALFFATWAIGGALAVVGALCYAELTTAFPSTGGDWHFVRLAYGRTAGFLFAWSRFLIIFAGSSAMLGFVLGDYLSQLVPMGQAARGLVAAGAIVLLALLNLRGIRVGAGAQVALVTVDVVALLLLGAAGLALVAAGAPAGVAVVAPHPPQVGAAMVFVMLAYGGWNDAATLSAEMRSGRGIVVALVGGMTAVAALYLLANWAYVRALGMGGLAASSAPASDAMRAAFGRAGEVAMVALVTVPVLAVMNALTIVGARTLFTSAGDVPALGALARWDAARGVPRAALWTQTGFALALVAYGTIGRGGFQAMVDFMAPVYWLFLAATGAALLVLRRTREHAARPFRVPLYPVLPLVFVASSLGVLWSSVAYVGWRGAGLSFGVLGVGFVVLWGLDRLGSGQQRADIVPGLGGVGGDGVG